MTSHFLVLRVRPAGHHQADRRAEDGSLPGVWLLAEWPPEAAEPTDYWLSSLPETTPLTELVRLAKIRWRIEMRHLWCWSSRVRLSSESAFWGGCRCGRLGPAGPGVVAG